MPSPFPGMDPYLEGYLWPDVHQSLASMIRRLLTPRLGRRYVARLDVYVVEDADPGAEIGIMYPDVEVVSALPERAPREARPMAGVPVGAGTQRAPDAAGDVVTLAAPLSVPLMDAVEVRLVSVEIRDTAGNTLVTTIEILSPINKRDPGLAAYRRKRRRLYQAEVHLLELDLIRRGTRPVAHPRIPDVPYLVALTRAGAGQVDVWPIGLRDPLPTVPIPLLAPDPDIPLDLSACLRTVYDEAAYERSIDYSAPPPPPALLAADAAWLIEVTRA